MSTYYLKWVEQLAVRDAAVERLAVMALAVILAWCLAEIQFPASWKPWIRKLYLVGGMGMYALTVAVAVWG